LPCFEDAGGSRFAIAAAAGDFSVASFWRFVAAHHVQVRLVLTLSVDSNTLLFLFSLSLSLSLILVISMSLSVCVLRCSDLLFSGVLVVNFVILDVEFVLEISSV
jgi:hypothetical protein